MLPLLPVVFLSALALTYGGAIRGLNPDLAAQYLGSGGTFTCISGITKTIPFARVNDDYCDCPDGSDEPGTSACHNGRFYCRNLGHEPRLLSTAFVDDGVCDCCDGTDEPKGKCQNTCLQASAVHREALKGKIAQYEQTLARKAEFITSAKSFKDDLVRKAITVDDDITAQQAEVDRLQEEVKRAEAEEAARRAEEARRREEQQAAQQQAEQEQAAREQAAREQASASAQTTGAEELETVSVSSADHSERELQEAAQQAQPEEREETPEERGRRIASQWTNDPESAAILENVKSEEQHEEQVDEEYQHYEPHHGGDYDRGADLPEGEYQTESVSVTPPPPASTTPAGTVRSQLYEARRKLERLQKDKEDVQHYLQRSFDYGPNNIFLAFANKCFTSYQSRWTYEACPFKHATQREGYTNSVTVGRWYGFSEDYKTMYFTGGDHCANVGPRTFTVAMECGHEDKLYDGEEPATCQYTAKFKTPILCNEQELEGLHQELRNLQAFEEEVQAIIAKDEL